MVREKSHHHPDANRVPRTLRREHRDIYIADDLTPTQYRCVLAHEISHAKHRDRGGHADRYTEQRADIEAARMLISQVEYQTAENIYDGDETLMAKEMNVMPWIIQAYKQWLHDNVAA